MTGRNGASPAIGPMIDTFIRGANGQKHRIQLSKEWIDRSDAEHVGRKAPVGWRLAWWDQPGLKSELPIEFPCVSFEMGVRMHGWLVEWLTGGLS